MEQGWHPKRQRSESILHPSIPQSQDVYDEICGKTTEQQQQQQHHANVWSSWFRNVQWIHSSSVDTSSCPAREDQSDPSTCPQNNKNEMNNYDKNTHLQDEIKTLSRQLLQIKQKLGPAAEDASRTNNNNHRRCTDQTNGRDARYIYERARRACNPFEVLGEGQHNGLNAMFMNRSAIKLANIDAILNWTLTVPPLIHPYHHTPIFVFVDLCGAPGGFSEYLLWRCESMGKVSACWGYGMSLHGSNEQGHGLAWKLNDKSIHNNENGMYVQYQISSGSDGTGDIYQWRNVQQLQKVMAQGMTKFYPCQEKGGHYAHLVVADGGFDKQRDADNQEEIAQKLILCEVAAALTLLRTNGTLIVKMFGAQTDVIRAILRHLFFAFEKIMLVKPISSRPASAERYIICSGFHGNVSAWDAVTWCNHMLLGNGCPKSNFMHLTSYRERSVALLCYLDEFDRDMLTLNLKSCFCILTHMSGGGLTTSREMNAEQMTFEESDYDSDTSTESPRVHIASYKFAWGLH